jgi:hypothetical protein
MITIFNPLTSQLNLNDSTNSQPKFELFFGGGNDGDVTLTSGVTTLTRDMFYRNLTISGTASILPTGYRIFVSETLNLTNAPANAINRNAVNAGNASGSTGGSGTSALAANTVGGSAGAVGGGAGGTGPITAGAQTIPAAIASQVTSLGGSNGQSGGGGTSTGSQNIRPQVLSQINSFYRVDHQILRGASLFTGGLSAAGATSGAGDGTNAGAGGGGGSSGSGIMCIFANTIARGPSTAAGCISVNGGSGGNGAASTLGTTGGGGGGAGGGGGVVILYYAQLTGSVATNAIRAYGGNGGNGGNSVTATRSAGQGGQGGSGGRILLFDLKKYTITETNGTRTHAAVPPIIAAGNQTGGTGTTGTQTQCDL